MVGIIENIEADINSQMMVIDLHLILQQFEAFWNVIIDPRSLHKIDRIYSFD